MTRDSARLDGQTLLFDADDTLWQNNIYFERAIAAFISLLDHHTHAPAEVRAHLDQIEHETVAAHGYGSVSFARSLERCFMELSGRNPNPEECGQLRALAASIRTHALELLPGVAETLAVLAPRHRLLLVTKGDAAEQRDKLARSGLHIHFAAVEVPREKDAEAYRELIDRYKLTPATTWMIGNSPRSDINPALAAELNAVFLAHDFTWVLEHATLATPMPGRSLLELESFAALARHFQTRPKAESTLY